MIRSTTFENLGYFAGSTDVPRCARQNKKARRWGGFTCLPNYGGNKHGNLITSPRHYMYGHVLVMSRLAQSNSQNF